MAKVSEQDVIRVLEERIATLENKIKVAQSALIALSGTDESSKPKLKKKERKMVKSVKTELKKTARKKDKAKLAEEGFDDAKPDVLTTADTGETPKLLEA